MGLKEYIRVDQIVHREGGWTEEQYDEFIDAYIDLIEEFNSTTGGGFQLMTEEELDEYEGD